MANKKRVIHFLVVVGILSPLISSEDEERFVPWYGLGLKECHGRETCSVGQYCTDNPVLEGCRNCTDILAWCTRDMDHVRMKFPSCEATCERELARIQSETMENNTKALRVEKEGLMNTIQEKDKKLLKLSKELKSTGQALKLAMDAKAELTENQDVVIWKPAFIVSVVMLAIVVCVTACVICMCWRENRRLLKRTTFRDNAPEATTPNGNGQNQTDIMPLLPAPVPAEDQYSQQTEDADSGHGVGTSGSSGTPSSSNTSLVAPTGQRTEHQPEDTGECMHTLGSDYNI